MEMTSPTSKRKVEHDGPNSKREWVDRDTNMLEQFFSQQVSRESSLEHIFQDDNFHGYGERISPSSGFFFSLSQNNNIKTEIEDSFATEQNQSMKQERFHQDDPSTILFESHQKVHEPFHQDDSGSPLFETDKSSVGSHINTLSSNSKIRLENSNPSNSHSNRPPHQFQDFGLSSLNSLANSNLDSSRIQMHNSPMHSSILSSPMQTPSPMQNNPHSPMQNNPHSPMQHNPHSPIQQNPNSPMQHQSPLQSHHLQNTQAHLQQLSSNIQNGFIIEENPTKFNMARMKSNSFSSYPYGNRPRTFSNNTTSTSGSITPPSSEHLSPQIQHLSLNPNHLEFQDFQNYNIGNHIQSQLLFFQPTENFLGKDFINTNSNHSQNVPVVQPNKRKPKSNLPRCFHHWKQKRGCNCTDDKLVNQWTTETLREYEAIKKRRGDLKEKNPGKNHENNGLQNFFQNCPKLPASQKKILEESLSKNQSPEVIFETCFEILKKITLSPNNF